MRRTGVLVVISALVLAGLTSCSAATEGAVGIRLDADGRLVGVLAWCPGKAGADEIVLYHAKDNGSVADEVVRLDRDPGRDARIAEDVVLLDPGSGWHANRTPSTLDDDRVYDLRAWNSNEGAVVDFPFRISEMRGRTGPDVILTKRWEGSPDRGRYVATFRTPEDFVHYANAVCGG
ncbi:hypothetical protein [Dactylosporangium sp. NPDC051484]|uniref:hypothetical protein n=1 Tax=Dactylosporangium sp. NPDC051484 TaxID=3154942 RepID=UPI0034510EFC